MNFDKYRHNVPYSRETREEYRAAEREVEKLFRNDLEDECGVPHDAQYANKLYQMAYEAGHSCGFSCVYQEYTDLLELVEATLKTSK